MYVSLSGGIANSHGTKSLLLTSLTPAAQASEKSERLRGDREALHSGKQQLSLLKTGTSTGLYIPE